MQLQSARTSSLLTSCETSALSLLVALVSLNDLSLICAYLYDRRHARDCSLCSTLHLAEMLTAALSATSCQVQPLSASFETAVAAYPEVKSKLDIGQSLGRVHHMYSVIVQAPSASRGACLCVRCIHSGRKHHRRVLNAVQLARIRTLTLIGNLQ